jgi:regulator of RNase E activity RraA
MPGDVLIVATDGDTGRAVMGEIVYRYAIWKGIVGFVIDGCVRDAVPLGRGVAPVLCRGISPLGPYRNGPGSVHGTVTIDGLIVEPGSVVVMDYDGVAVVPANLAASVAAAGEEALAAETKTLEMAGSGTLDRRWVEIAASSPSVGFR